MLGFLRASPKYNVCFGPRKGVVRALRGLHRPMRVSEATPPQFNPPPPGRKNLNGGWGRLARGPRASLGLGGGIVKLRN